MVTEPSSVTLSIKIIDLIMKLVNRRGELNKEYFNQFIKPTWEIFNEIHDNYKYTFTKYVEKLNIIEENMYSTKLHTADNHVVDKIIREIIWDSIYTEDLRTELNSIINHTPPRDLAESDQFINAINSYFTFDFYVGDYNRTRFVGSFVPCRLNPKEIINDYDLLNVSNDQRFCNVPRIVLIGYLKKKDNHNNIEEIIIKFGEGVTGIHQKEVSRVLSKIQSNYENVADAYYNLKGSLKA